MKEKIKINALDLYMMSKEVKKALIWNNLNLKYEVTEKIEFLEENIWNEVFVHWLDQDTLTIKISKYEKWKIYEFPFTILSDIEEEEIQEEEEQIQEEKKETFFEKNKIIILPLIAMISIFGYIIIPKSSLVEALDNEISQFELNYQEINKINDQISQELENQKEMRKMKEEIDKKINESIKRVQDNEKKQNEIRLDSLNLSNKI